MNGFIDGANRQSYYEVINGMEVQMSIEQLYLAPGEGEAVALRGTEAVFKAVGERDAGGPTVMEWIVAPGFSTGDHVHTKVEEIFYVVDGELKIRAGEWTGVVRAGGFARVPTHTAHGFSNPGTAPATMLLIISPAAVHEDYFRELAAILAKPGPPDTAAIADLRKRFDTEQVSPLAAN